MGIIGDRAFVAAEILDDVFGNKDYHERLADELVSAYDSSLERYAEYGYSDDEKYDYALKSLSNRIWMWYSGGDTCYAAGRRVVEAWQHAGLVSR